MSIFNSSEEQLKRYFSIIQQFAADLERAEQSGDGQAYFDLANWLDVGVVANALETFKQTQEYKDMYGDEEE